MNRMLRLSALLLAWSIVLPQNVFGETIRVSSLSELHAAISKAKPGDVIILANGVYTSTDDIIVNNKGTEAQPITITTEKIGGAEITGDGGFRLQAPAMYIIIKGFKFSHAAKHAKSDSGTGFCRWTQNIFETPGEGDYLSVSGSDHQIDHNTFQNKNSIGKFIAVRGHESQIAQRLWIHHNYFFNFLNQGGANGAEALQFGLSGFSLSSSNSIVEYNLFEKCHGENELISVKASEVILRYNTIRDCPAQFTLRHGNRSHVYGNYFINTPGLRIFGDDHMVHSNYFEKCRIALNIGNGGGEVADGAKLTSHDRPDRVLIAFNTMVNNERNIVQTLRKDGLGSIDISIFYNLIQGGGVAAEIAGPFINPKWKGNILFQTAGPGDIPVEGYRTLDPRMSRDASGVYHLHDESAARNATKENFPTILSDMDGQPRTGSLDVGADEVSDARKSARILTPKEVGPDATHTAEAR